MANSNRARILALVEQYTPVLRRAFLDAIANIQDNAELGRIARALEAGNIDDALRAIHLDAAAFSVLDLAIAQTYVAGGQFAVEKMPTFRETTGALVVVRFDARNPRAESYLSEHSSELITNIVDDQRTAIRTALTEGMAQGRGPRDVALDIVGRIDPATGKRTGSVVGLTAQQEQFARNYRDELLSADPAVRAKALKRTLRDKRFDSRIEKAIASEKPLEAETVTKLVTRYKSSLLRMRGEMIGRTEAMASLHAAQDEAYQQAIDKGAVKASAIKKVWSDTGDTRVRDTHVVLNGQRVPKDGVFVSPSGARLRYPGDPKAPAGEIIHCRCGVDYEIDFMAGVT